MKRTKLCVLALSLAALLPRPAFAQNQQLSKVLVDLLVRAASMPSTTQTVAGNPHEAHFLPAAAQAQAPFEINKAIAAQLGTFPIGSSSGGFSFSFDPTTGLYNRTTQSFGPGFAERARTNGRNRFGFGINYQHLSFSKFEGIDLGNEDPSQNIGFVLQHNDCCPGQNSIGVPGGSPASDPKDPFFEGDLVEMSLSMSLKTDIVAPFVNYGISDRWDVGLVVPIVRVELDADITSTLDRISTGANPLIHSFDGNGAGQEVVLPFNDTPFICPCSAVTGTPLSAAGVGDIALRTKYRVLDAAHGGVALGLDLRLPTGDKENLLGTGAVQTKLMAIASKEFSRVAPHINVGYTFSHGDLSSSLTSFSIPSGLPGSQIPYDEIFPNGIPVSSTNLELPNEVDYVGGADIIVHPTVTVSADLIGRALLDTPRFGLVPQAFNYRTANNGPVFQTTRQAVDITGTGTMNLLLGVVGAKVNIPNTPLLLTASVLFPLTDAGLRPNVTPVIGLDYSFKR